MGCVVSKMDDSQLVILCKERKKMIGAAADCRYVLAYAHILYFKSLLEVGIALNRFFEGVGIHAELPHNSESSNHQPLGDDSHLEFPLSNSESKAGALTDDVHGGEGMPKPQLEHSPLNNPSRPRAKLSSLHSDSDSGSVPDDVDGDCEMPKPKLRPSFPTNLTQPRANISSLDSDSEAGSMADDFNEDWGLPEPRLEPSPPRDHGLHRGDLNIDPMNRYGVEIPSGIYEPPSVFPTTNYGNESSKLFAGYPRYGSEAGFRLFGVPIDFQHNDYRFFQSGYEVSSGTGTFSCVLLDLPPQNSRFPEYGNGMAFSSSMCLPRQDQYYNRVQSPAPPPPLPEVFTCDYLDPFSSICDNYSSYYSQSIYETAPGNYFPDLREVRERERIPDLEDETKQNPTKELLEEIKLEEGTRGVSGGDASEAAPFKNHVAQVVQEKESKRSPNVVVASEAAIRSSPDVVLAQEEESKGHLEPTKQDTDISGVSHLPDDSGKEDIRKEGATLEIVEVTQEGESSRPVGSTTLPTHGTRDFYEVLKEIRDAFETAFNSAEEVSVMLEADKQPYLSTGTKVKVFYYHILGFLAPSLAKSLPTKYTLWKQLSSRTMIMAKANSGNLEKDIPVKSCRLSSILELLYVWEKKLHDQVKDEEEFRAMYEKECKRLKYLEDRGAESSKIDATHASIIRLLSKINVAVTTVDVISGRIHKLRDEELQPEVNELIQGLKGMWKFMSECHQKQSRAIKEVKTVVLIANAGTQSYLSLRATLELERKILTWGTRLKNWIDAQKAFFRFLNEWLLKSLLQESDETPDGIAPFSPGKIGAPPIFVICNDWYHAFENISGTEVLKAIHDFASLLHQLWVKQNEEQHLRLQVEYLSKDLEKRLKSLCKESGASWDEDAFSSLLATSEGLIESKFPLLFGLTENLNAMRERLNKRKARHEQAVKQVNDAAQSILEGGIVPVFEALERFCSEMLKAYDQVRIQDGGSKG